MSSDKETEKSKEMEGENSGVTPSIAKLRRLLGPSPEPRMLTPYEIELLRKCNQEVVQVVSEVLAGKRGSKRQNAIVNDRCVSN